jgi:cytochrome c-type biogenesis protein CcmE
MRWDRLRRVSTSVPEPIAPDPASPSRTRTIRLVFALVVASLLGTFAVYTAFAGSSVPLMGVAQASSGTHEGTVRMAGKVIATERAEDGAMRFTLEDDGGGTTVDVAYKGSIPDAFAVDRYVVVDGAMSGGTFVAEEDTLVTKCPSKYSDGVPDPV